MCAVRRVEQLLLRAVQVRALGYTRAGDGDVVHSNGWVQSRDQSLPASSKCLSPTFIFSVTFVQRTGEESGEVVIKKAREVCLIYC